MLNSEIPKNSPSNEGNKIEKLKNKGREHDEKRGKKIKTEFSSTASVMQR